MDILKTNEQGTVMMDVEGKPLREILLEVDDIHKALLERNKKHFHQAAALHSVGKWGMVFLLIWLAIPDSLKQPRPLWMVLFSNSMAIQ